MTTLAPNKALIVVDVQNGFCPSGNLPVPHGDQVVQPINQIAKKFENVVITQDWHPSNHISFAENHADKKPFEQIEVSYGKQVLWPTHCVQGTIDADLHPQLNIPHAQLIIRKGFHAEIDSYSAFLEADQKTSTGLEGYLKQRGIDTVYIVGLATDFCVAWTALHARQFGFETFVVEDACRGIDLDGSLQKAWDEMHASGVISIQSKDV